jgi:uncharacterized protein
MADPALIHLNTERLTGEPEAHRFEKSASWWETLVAEPVRHAPSTGPLVFEVDASIQGAAVHLSGRVTGEVEMQCSRCLKRYRHPLADTFRVVLAAIGDRAPADPESAEALARDGMSLGDDFEAGWYRGPEIRLEAFLAEVVSSAIPIQPLCREDCAGLCPRCGTDKNVASCDCEELKPNSPFAVLAKLRTGSEEGRG